MIFFTQSITISKPLWAWLVQLLVVVICLVACIMGVSSVIKNMDKDHRFDLFLAMFMEACLILTIVVFVVK